MATYIAKNKMRPRPEWQKNLAAVRRSERTRSASSTRRFRRAKAERKPHPMINKRFPLVMMLEPLHACNLTCTGCGRIREYESTIRERLTLEQCLKAVDECGAPMISICGGEPFLYPELPKLCEEILARGKYIQLCTNGMFIGEAFEGIQAASGPGLQRPPGRHGKESRSGGGARRRVQGRHRGHQDRQGRRFPRVHQHHGVSRNRHERNLGDVRVPGAIQGRRPHHRAGLRLLRR